MNKKIILISILAITIVGSVGILYSMNIDNNTASFQLPIPDIVKNDLVALGLTENPNVFCRYQSKMYEIDSTGGTVDTSLGGTQTGYPKFSVVEKSSGKVLAGIVGIPKFGCDINTANVSIIMAKTTLNAKFFAKNPLNGAWTKFDEKTFTVNETPFGNNYAGEKSIGAVSAGGSASSFNTVVQNAIGTKLVDTQVRMEIDGVLPVFYEVTKADGSKVRYETVKYYFDINPTTTFALSNTLQVGTVTPTSGSNTVQEDPATKDSDDDGIVDLYDTCRTTKETFNGYKDGDGCPDTPPTTTNTGTTSSGTDTKTTCESAGYTWDTVTFTCNTVPKTTTTDTDTPATEQIDTDEECQELDPNTRWNGDVCEAKQVNANCLPISSGLQKICKDDPEFQTGGICFGKTLEQCQVHFNEINSGGQPTTTSSGGSTGSEVLFVTTLNYADGGRQIIITPSIGSGFPITLTPADILGNDGTSKSKRLSTIDSELFIDFKDAKTAQLYRLESSDIFFNPSVRVSGSDLDMQPRKQIGAFKTAGQTLFNAGDTAIYGLSLGSITISANELHGIITEELVPVGQNRDMSIRIDVSGSAKLRVIATGVESFVVGSPKDTFLKLDTISISRPVVPTTGGGVTGTLKCSGDFYLGEVDGVQTCLPNGKTPNDENPNQQPKLGDEGVLVCQLKSDKNVSFLCTADYRETFCGGTTDQCVDTPKSTNDDIYNVDAPDECKDTSLQSASFLASGDCFTTSSDPKVESDGVFCPSGIDCSDPFRNFGSLNDSLTILVVVGGAMLVIGLAVAKKKQSSPLPRY